jgi:hypothetical protein
MVNQSVYASMFFIKIRTFFTFKSIIIFFIHKDFV